MKKSILFNLIAISVLVFCSVKQSNAQFATTSLSNLTTLPDKNNVGIGITDPNLVRRLHIYKQVPTSVPPGFIYQSTGLRLHYEVEGMSPVGVWDLASSGSGFHLYEALSDFTVLYANINGYVGVGTTSPLGRLDVNSGQSSNYTDALYVGGHPTIPNLGGIIHHQNDVHAWQEIAQNTGSVGNGILTYNYTTKLAPGGQIITPNVMVLHAQGRVGINRSPEYHLDVNGDSRMDNLDVCNKIRAEEVEVLLNTWCDYVFEDGYELRTLEDLEKYIDEKGHLPEIPSTEEVEENGVNLGEMNALLLKKIEELTLYVLEQNNKIKALEDQVHNSK